MSDLRELVARVVYSLIPTGGEVSVQTTSTDQAGRAIWAKEYHADSWEEAPDRHEQCFEIADAVLKIVNEHERRMSSPSSVSETKMVTDSGV